MTFNLIIFNFLIWVLKWVSTDYLYFKIKFWKRENKELFNIGLNKQKDRETNKQKQGQQKQRIKHFEWETSKQRLGYKVI